MTKRFLIIAALALLVRVWAVFTERLPLSGDEMAHGNYVAYIHEHWSLPDSAVANEFLPAGQEGLVLMSYEFYQPPGYYILAAVFGGGTPLGSRLVSVAMFMVAFFFVWAATRKPGSEGDLPLLCAMAFIPGIIVTTSLIGNDVFLIMGSAIMLYACLKKKTWAFIVGALVLATSKFHSLPILLVLGIYYLVKRNNRWGIMGLAFAAVAGGIILWRWNLQVENTGLELLVPSVLNVAKIIHETLITGFIYPFYDHVAPDLMGLATLGGIVLIFFAVRRFRRLSDIQKYVIIAVCLVWAGWCIFKMFPAGRYLYAAIPWLAVVGKKAESPNEPTGPASKYRRKPARNK